MSEGYTEVLLHDNLQCSFHLRQLILTFLKDLTFTLFAIKENGFVVYIAEVSQQTLGEHLYVFCILQTSNTEFNIQLTQYSPVVCMQFVHSFVEYNIDPQPVLLNTSPLRDIKFTIIENGDGYTDYLGQEGTRLRLYNNKKRQTTHQYPDIVRFPLILTAYKSVLSLCT